MSRDLEAIREAVQRDLAAEGAGLLVPCSRYGNTTGECALPASAAAMILLGETDSDDMAECAERVMGLVVNDHPDPAYLIVTYGPEYGFDPARFLDPADFPEIDSMNG